MKTLGKIVGEKLLDEGVYFLPGVDPDEYHAAKGEMEEKLGVPVVSKSLLADYIHDSYGSWWRRAHGVKKKSAALETGSLVDCLALTPERVEYAIVDATDKRSKAWKEAVALMAEGGVKPVLRAEYDWAKEVAAAVQESIEKRHGEYDTQVGMWMYVDRLDDAPLPSPVVITGMIDALPRSEAHPIVDLKTTSQPLTSKEAINKNMAQFGYGIQAAMYCDLLMEVAGQDRDFEFLFAGLDAPTRLRWVTVNRADVEMYRMRYFAAVRMYAMAWGNNNWGSAELPEMQYAPPAWDTKPWEPEENYEEGEDTGDME